MHSDILRKWNSRKMSSSRQYTTLKIGGPARFFAHIASTDELLQAVQFARKNHLPMYVLGGGSNLVIPDEGYRGLVLHLTIATPAKAIADNLYLEAPAGEDWDALVLNVCRQGISGIECLAGIPGLVGGSPIQNIGAYGQEVSSRIAGVHVLDLQTLQFTEIRHADCRFAYRRSIFNSIFAGRYIVTQVDFHFDRNAIPDLTYADLAPLRGTSPTPLDVYHAVRAIRDRKGMVIHPGSHDPDTRSAGSFFKNPVVPLSALQRIAQNLGNPAEKVPNWPTSSGETKLPAAWLIEQAGFAKGFELGPVAISTRHTLALTNRSGGANCGDLFKLRDLIVQTIDERFAIQLEQEPVILS